MNSLSLKRISVLTFSVLCPVVLLVSLASGFSQPRLVSVVPGISVGAVVLGEKVKSLSRLYSGIEYNRVKHRVPHKIFADVFGVPLDRDVVFDEMFYYESVDLAVFSSGGIITAVMLMNGSVVLEKGPSLSKGMDHVLLFFGNSGLFQFERKNRNLYVYRERGIAFFDDRGDGSVNMVAVFLP